MLQSNMQFTPVSAPFYRGVLNSMSCTSPRNAVLHLNRIRGEVIEREGVYPLPNNGSGLCAYYEARKKFYGNCNMGDVLVESYSVRGIILAMWFTTELGYRFWEIQSFIDNTKLA